MPVPRAPLLLACLWLGCASAPPRPAGPAALAAQETTVPAQTLTDATVQYAGQLTTPGEAVLEKADYELVSDGVVVKTGSAALNARLVPGQPTAFSFREQASYVKGPEDLRALSERGGTLLLALRGTLTVRSGEAVETVPFAASRAVRVPRLPTLVIESLDGARYSDEEVNLIVRVGVKNPNPFPLRVDALTYSLQVAGKSLGEGTLAKGDTVDPSATGVYPVEASVTKESFGPEVKKLIATGTLPYRMQGELKGPHLQVPYALEGSVKINTSR
ncbi:LEA type 2 family protein [Stigmatella hybrida]|uniref:LEA type 2 family protein n=1 Tax=Stigmatella hybrida TaxID=394097 RepID=UPI0021E1809C